MLEPAVHQALLQVSTATITTILLKQGIRNVWLRNTRHLCGLAPRVAGPAFTLRFIAGREDLSKPDAWSSPTSTRACVEAMPRGCIAVADAPGVPQTGIMGDILCARMQSRGVLALVTDGAIRDIAGIRSVGFDVWASGVSAPPAVTSLHFVGWEQPISCGGVAVFPGDVIVADDDGAVVIPIEFVPHVLQEGEQQERLEAWTLEQVQKGHALTGLYPIDDANRRRYEADSKTRGA